MQATLSTGMVYPTHDEQKDKSTAEQVCLVGVFWLSQQGGQRKSTKNRLMDISR